MFFLTSTSDKIQVITGSSGTVDVHASWSDIAAGVVTVGRTNTKITTATTTDVVASPAASTSRNVRTLIVSNNHASTANLVTLQHTDGTNVIPIESVNLQAGERMSYAEGHGLRVIDVNGVEKNNIAIAAGQYEIMRLSATVSNSTTTAAKITGLDAPTGAGTWVFEYFLRFQSATGTVGFKLGCNHTGTVTTFDYTITFPTGTTTDSTGVADQVVTAPGVPGVLADRAKSTTAPGIMTAGVDTTASDILVQITGLAVVTVSGNLELYHASETATSTSIMLDSVLRLTKFA